MDIGELLKFTQGMFSASLGCMVRLLNTKEKKKRSWRSLLSEIFTACVVGIAVIYAANWRRLDWDAGQLFCLFGGWMGARAFDIGEGLLTKSVGEKRE